MAELRFDYAVDYSGLPMMPVAFSQEGGTRSYALCLIDSGASGILLPSEFASELGISLEDPSLTIIGVTGTAQGWSYPLVVSLPEIDGHTFVTDVVFLADLPVALLGRNPAFDLLDIAFQQRNSRILFNPVDVEA